MSSKTASSPQISNGMLLMNPQQYEQYNKNAKLYNPRAVLNGTRAGDSTTSYNVPVADYIKSYNSMNRDNLIRSADGGMSFPNPSSFGDWQSGLTQSKPTPMANIQRPPSYAEFAAARGISPNGGNVIAPSAGGNPPGVSAGGPSTYSGGSAPAGMNPQAAQMLQSIYAPPPPRAAGGFVSPYGDGISPRGYAEGGAPSGSEMASWYTRRQASENVHDGGLFKSPVPGRTDKLDTLVPGGAYVLPADVVSGLGQGNTMAGSAVLDKMFSTGPYGMSLRGGHGGSSIPSAPGVRALGRAAGGRTESHVPIIAAGGEYLIPPEVVQVIGGGDIDKGHKILDHFVVHARKKTAAEMNKLPGPKK